MTTKRRRPSSRERFINERVAGWINLDIYRISIPICLTTEACKEICEYDGIDWAGDPGQAVMGYAGWGEDANGNRLHYVVLPPESNTNTWVHEASHLTDFVIDLLGLDPSIEGTEARAYLMGHIFSSIEATMLEIQETLSIPEVVTAIPYNEKPI